MPQREILAYLIDIRAAALEIDLAVVGLTLETYQNSRPPRSAVEREFMIIGEAMRQLIDMAP